MPPDCGLKKKKMYNIQIQKQQPPQQQNPALVRCPYTGFKGEKTLQISAKTEIFLLYRRRKGSFSFSKRIQY